MPVKTIVAKNPTGSPVTISGIDVTILGGQSFTLSDFFRLEEIQECTDLTTKINAGDIVINDGINDLTQAQSLQYVTPVLFPEAPSSGWKWPVRVATTASITLSGTQTIDGVALSANDRVLVKNQGTGSQNGLYIVKSGAWVRAPDFDEGSEVVSGMMVVVAAGSTLAGKVYRLSTVDPITVGSTSLTWTEFAGGGGGSGDVVGPASSTNNAIARFDGVTGKLLKGGVSPQIDDSGNMNMGGQQITNVGTLAIANLTVTTGGSFNIQAGATADLGDVSVANVGPLRYKTTNSAPATDQNNFDPTSFAGTNILRLAPTAAITISGMLGGVGSGGSERELVVNISSFSVTLLHESASSSAANRFILPGGRSLILGPGRAVEFYYDTTSSRWRACTPPGVRRSITFVVNADTAVATGGKAKTLVRCPFAGVITGWNLTSDVATTTTIDVWKAAGSVPTNANTITASAKPALSAASVASSTTLTGWTTTVAEGDVLQIEVEANSAATHLCLVLDIEVQ